MSVKIALCAPIPIEYKAARDILGLRENEPVTGCRLCTGEKSGIHVYCLLTGPGKARSAQATSALIGAIGPSLIVDTGTCAGLGPVAAIGDIILSTKSYEFDIAGAGIPTKKMDEMEVESGFRFLPRGTWETLVCRAGAYAQKLDLRVLEGAQATGEILVNIEKIRDSLFDLFQATGANWETAAVFLCALRASLPAISFRVVSDNGGRNALKEFREHARRQARNLYRFIDVLLSSGWFGGLLDEWSRVKDVVKKNLPGLVKP